MTKNLTMLDRVFRAIVGLIILWLAAVVFTDQIWRTVAAVLGLGALLESLSGYCALHARLGGKATQKHLPLETLLVVILMSFSALIGFEWIGAGYEKLSSGTFPQDLTKIIAYFASRNPYPWYRDFLVWLTSQNVRALGYIVEWGQFAAGIALIAGPLTYLWAHSKTLKKIVVACMVAALIGGVIMNAHFYLASGWTSAGTSGVNYLMFWSQLLLIYFLAWVDDARLS